MPVAEVAVPHGSSDPVSDTWRSIAPTPGLIERNSDVAWAGDRPIVWPRFFTSSPGLSYDPEADTWERLPPVPDDIRPDIGSMVWTGEEVLVWGVAARDQNDATRARYDLDSRTWRPLADDPLPPFEWFEGTPGSQAAVWTAPPPDVPPSAQGLVDLRVGHHKVSTGSSSSSRARYRADGT